MDIVEADNNNFNDWLRMGLLLWPEHTKDDLKKELEKSLASDSEKTLLCKDENGRYIGFQTVSLRNEYVSGAKTSPIGYLEGIYVDNDYRKKGVARKLVEAAEKWAKEKGCKELASDTWDWNTDSIKFHEKLGFNKVKTLVHFIKSVR